ncbi:MAG TPA: hypothetical protein VIL20_29720 [Sandaracinaceae bacterium]
MRPSPQRLLALALVSALVCAPLATVRVARGQDRPTGPREEAEILEGEPEEEALDQEVDSEVRTERGGEKVKVFRFSGLDVSGRLKSPQLLYFLNRLRAEFDRPRLPHRSFIPELQRSAQGKAFR